MQSSMAAPVGSVFFYFSVLVTPIVFVFSAFYVGCWRS
jgi:hypothetical protein